VVEIRFWKFRQFSTTLTVVRCVVFVEV